MCIRLRSQKLLHVRQMCIQCLPGGAWISGGDWISDCMVQMVRSSLGCSVPPPYPKHWALLVWPGSGEADAAGGEAKASWNDLVGVRGLSVWEFKGSFMSIVLRQGPVKVKHKLPVRFSEIKIIPTLSVWKWLNSEMMPLVRNPEEHSTVNDSHAPSKWSHAVKQRVLIA